MMTTVMRGLMMSTLLTCALPALAEDPAPGTMEKTAMGEALADGKGMALYTLETDSRGKSTCNDDCAVQWPPMMVAEGLRSTGDWSVVVRDDGSRQWAYLGQPLYTYVEDKTRGEVNGDSKGGFHLAGLSDADRAVFVAATHPLARMGLTTKGMAWVNSNGKALYTFDKDIEGNSMCNGDCAVAWPPLMVGDGAVESADWTIVLREDGTKMWALKGKPLYTYAGDKAAGEVMGDNLNGFHLAM